MTLNRKAVRLVTFCQLLVMFASGAHAVSPIPTETGFSGFVNLGVVTGTVESNFLASVIGVDLGEDSISSLTQSPGSQSVVLPIATGELSYTFADSGTQIFAGQLLEDYLTMDLSTRAGVRQQMGGAGIASLSLVGTTTVVNVWNDPYVTEDIASRKSTERTTKGLRLAWGEIMGTGLEISYSQRELDIDGEESGAALVAAGELTLAEQALLKRDGDISHVEVSYRFNLDTHERLIASLRYNEHDRDGDAMSWDGYAAELSYMKVFNQHWSIVANANYGQFEAKEENPIYSEHRDFTRFGTTLTAFYARPFGLQNWSANISALYFNEDSDIDFYDHQIKLIALGMLFRF